MSEGRTRTGRGGRPGPNARPRPPQAGVEGFETSEGLRALLNRLGRDCGRWRDDPEAAALMQHAARKYAALARKHGLDPWEAATAAFDAMRNPSVRRAADPWAVVTHAVRITCIAEERAQGLLCSTGRARRPGYAAFHDAQRISDREMPLTDYHPAFRAQPADADDAEADPAGGSGTGPCAAVEDAVGLFALLGWPAATARAAVLYVCARLAESGSRASAFEALRRDYHARALLDLTGASWMALLRAMLGNPDPDLARTGAGRGVLLRLLVGEQLTALLSDDALLAEVARAAPSGKRRG